MIGRLALLALPALALAACGGAGGGGAREQIKVVGSSTVYPFTTAVAEAFVNRGGNRKAPVIESIGTGAGFKQFCAGIGTEYPDIANASRRIKKSEFDQCTANGVGEVLEIQIGIDGVAMAESQNGPKFALTKKDVYLALAAKPKGTANTAKTWQDVNPALPAIPIQVYGPPATSGTRDAFVELIMEPGCIAAMPEAKALKDSDKAKFDETCQRLRDDGPYVDTGENDNLIVQKLGSNSKALGIFGYSYLEENHDRLRGVPVEGVEPTYATISDGSYPGARPLFIYVKKRHLKAVPGLPEFLQLYAEMWGPDGALVKRGLIAAPQDVRDHASQVIAQSTPLDASGLK